MDFTSKPILYNGYKLNDSVEIKRRIEKIFFIEIYELSDQNFFYLFTNHKLSDIEKKLKIYNQIRINFQNTEYLGIINSNYSFKNISDINETLNSNRGLDCVAGMENLKKILIKNIIQPLVYPEKYKKFKLSIPNGILLYGPPGCGKTFIIRKLAEELNYYFIEVKHSDISSPFIHESASKIAGIFEKAKIHAPSIVFIDEIEGIIPRRENLNSNAHYKQEEVNEFLRHLNDAGKNNILVVGATNQPQLIDSAILRSGRMDKRIFVPPPDFEARKELFKIYLKDRPHAEHINFDNLARMTERFVCSDIELIISESAREAIEQNRMEIDEKMIELEILKSVPSLTQEELEDYHRYNDMERH